MAFSLTFIELQYLAHSLLDVIVRVSERNTVAALLQGHMAFLVQSWYRRVGQFGCNRVFAILLGH